MKRISCVSVKEIQWILDFWRPLFCTDNPKWYIQSSAMKLQQKDRPLKPKWETESSHATGTIPQFSPWREERMKRRMEEYERTQLLVVWTEERGRKKRGEKKLGFPQPICQLLLFIGLKVKIELTTDFLYLLSYFEGPVIHGYPCSLLGSSSAQYFMLLQRLAHKIHLFV